MLRLRLFASLLSVLTLAAMALAVVSGVPIATAVALLAAAACLAAIAPFDAPEPRQRWRVVLACAIYVGAVAAALLFAYPAPDTGLLKFVLILLGLGGVGLTLWAFATRRRRRMPRSSRYYDN
jgi:4-amino-4-deoxy-L-arabinose transferase-like glycosyltransferase